MMYASSDFRRELERVRRVRTRNTALAVFAALVIVVLLVWFLLGPAIR